MTHTIIQHWGIHLIDINGSTYDIDVYSERTGISVEELTNTAESIEVIAIEDEHPEYFR